MPVNDSPASVPKCSLAKDSRDAIPSFDLSMQTRFGSCHSSSFSDDDDSVPTSEPLSELQTLSSKVHRLLSFEKLDDYAQQSETTQACSLSLRTRLPLFLQNTDQKQQDASCQRQSALALLRATQYVDRLEQGLSVESNNTSLDEQLRTVLSGLDVESFPESIRNNIAFRLSSWVHGFDLPIGGVARMHLNSANGKQLPLLVEVEPIVEFRTGDFTSISYATRAAKACAVAVKSHRHISCEIGGNAGIVGEGTIQIHVIPLDSSSLVNDEGKALSLQVKEIRVCQLNAHPAKPATTIDLYTSHNHGDPGVIVTCTFKTSTTANNETPILHIDLCMAPPQAV